MNKIKFHSLDHNGLQRYIGFLNVMEVKSIEPKFESARHTLNVQAILREGDLKDIFYDIWAAVGDDTIAEWIKAEGFKMNKVNSLTPSPENI